MSVESIKTTADGIKPLAGMSWGGSLLYFGIPALLMVSGYYLVMPALIRRGMLPYYAYVIGLGVPLLMMLAASLVVLRLEGYPVNLESLAVRFRYQKMKGSDWLWTGGIFILEMAVYQLLVRVSAWLIETGVIPLPNNLPAFVDPATVFSPDTLDQAAGGLRGNWAVFIISFVLLIVNVVGEEFWWRGVIFPRQALVFGAAVWLVHGLFWTGFHAYKFWDLLNLLPLSLGLAYVVSRTGNSTPGLVIHFITNGVGLLPILFRTLGWQ